MQAELISIQAVKSISQRSLALHWLRLHAKLGLPQFGDFSPGDRAHDPRQILVWTIEEWNGERSYRHLYAGRYVFEAFGPSASVDSIPERLRDIFMSGLEACEKSANIIYMTIATSDAAGHRIECERLLLPFGKGGRTVTHVLASLQLVSVDGTFQRNSVMRQFEAKTEMTFCGRIIPVSPARIAARPADGPRRAR
jgi:hypothetical protein